MSVLETADSSVLEEVSVFEVMASVVEVAASADEVAVASEVESVICPPGAAAAQQ
jgi:hypothetical protein